MLREATTNRPLLRRVSYNMAKTYNTTPEILTVFLGIDWQGKDASVFVAFREILLNLASMQPNSISLILHTLISRLVKRKEKHEGEEEETMVDTRTLETIISLIKLVPATSGMLMTAIEFHFPFYMRSVHEHVSYVRNILELADRLPSWRYKIFELIICKALAIDVELQNYHDVLDKIGIERVGEVSLNGAETNSSRIISEDDLAKARDSVRKLDCLMTLMFAHIDHIIYTEERRLLNEERLRQVFAFLLEVFEKSVFSTFKSRHLQFLIYYLTSIMPALADQFLGVLFKPLVKFCQELDQGRSSSPTTALLTSISYIGSYAARANFLSTELLKMTFEMLSDLSIRLLDKGPMVGILPIMSLQHLMYIFYARHKQIVSIFRDDELMDVFDILFGNETILSHCHQEIVEKFLALADDQLGLLDPEVATIYKRNLRGTVERKSMSKYEDYALYFPFDPMVLPLCKNLITSKVYRFGDDAETSLYLREPSLR